MKETRQKMELYFKEVERGNREEEFLKWNAIVVNTLGIDNNMMFSAPEEEWIGSAGLVEWRKLKAEGKKLKAES